MDRLIAALKDFFPKHLHSSIFMVGGMVRDVLLGVECQDVDLAAAVPVSELSALGFRLVESKSTPNIYFRFKDPFGKVEITWLPTLDALPDDLSRRDFTVNAMAMSLEGRLSDPLGGQADLQRRTLRCCSPTSLTDDPLRILRGFRFECEGWRLDAEAEAILQGRDWSAELQRIPVERFSQEMLKAIPKEDPSRFFRRMVQFGIGTNFLPEIFRMAEITAGPPQHHPEGDLLTHSLQVLERMAQLTPDPTARFCALFHDLGKLYTPPELHPKHHGHDALGAQQVPAFCKRLRLPVALQRALQAINRLHNNANRWEELRDSTKIRLALDAIKGGIQDFLPLQVAADFHASMPGWEVALEVARMNAAQLGIDPALLDNKEVPPEKLQQIIMQHRVEQLKKGVQD
ncbi:HD domain-containing protein [Geomonas paludis]|uniref:HD domain-containing protein n=1 Tax=Geomonas paludis TaxID=2740185 RepID=A0A6V8MZJ1_9BACT|nr:HD domain-containing protein [Geomonas paludis]UPU34680.1 HD domain-containing protein [Geomonas paludis]GFO65057.1 multifunctional CCA protein [Geomonas paludis]